MPQTRTRRYTPPSPEPMNTSTDDNALERGDEMARIPAGLEESINGPVDRVLEANSLMTTAQAVELLYSQGVSQEKIVQLAKDGIDLSMQSSNELDGIPDDFHPEDGDVENIISLLSQSNWGDEYRSFQAEVSNPGNRPGHMSHLQPMATPAAYNDLDSNVHRYAPHMRPKLFIPPYEVVKRNPTTLQRERDPKVPGFKERDPSIIIIYMLGLPGSGKTTVAKAICKKYHLRYIGVAELLQQERENPASPYKSALDDMLSKGLLGPYKMVPSILISEILKEMEKGFKQIFVIDGFPRDIDRAVYFEEKMQPCDVVFNLKCSEKTAFGRMVTDPMASADELKDFEETKRKVNKRLDTYQKEAGLVIDYYTKQGKIATIDAELGIEKVQAQVELKLKDAIVDGFVGNRKEAMDEKNKNAWEGIRESIEKQWAANGCYKKEMDDSRTHNKNIVYSSDDNTDMDTEEGGVSLNTEDNSYHAWQVGLGNGYPPPQPQPLSQGDGHPTKTTPSESPNKSSNGHIGPKHHVKIAEYVLLSSENDLGDEIMLTKDAGKTPKPKQPHHHSHQKGNIKPDTNAPPYAPRPSIFMRALGRKASNAESLASSVSGGEGSGVENGSNKLDKGAKRMERKRSVSDRLKQVQGSECLRGQQ
ncbi:hypothetical protein ABW20_dc0108530 [Dactylellina cionopaga]|nr:hypothetical protein ABW20_dc0108530 [Dactylellina cionopaga]